MTSDVPSAMPLIQLRAGVTSERVTDEKNTTEDWGLIMDLCDRAAANPKDAMRSIVRRLNHRNPHVQLQAITVSRGSGM